MKPTRKHDPREDPCWANGADDVVAVRATRQAGSLTWRIQVATGVYTEVVELWGRLPDGTRAPYYFGMHEVMKQGELWDVSLPHAAGAQHLVGHIVAEVIDRLEILTDVDDVPMDPLF